MEKYYKISESNLIELLSSSIRMEVLDRGGVDNWSWYGVDFKEAITEYGDNCDTFEDCARTLLSDYIEVED